MAKRSFECQTQIASSLSLCRCPSQTPSCMDKSTSTLQFLKGLTAPSLGFVAQECNTQRPWFRGPRCSDHVINGLEPALGGFCRKTAACQQTFFADVFTEKPPPVGEEAREAAGIAVQRKLVHKVRHGVVGVAVLEDRRREERKLRTPWWRGHFPRHPLGPVASPDANVNGCRRTGELDVKVMRISVDATLRVSRKMASTSRSPLARPCWMYGGPVVR